ncbi:MAG: hypothetical protein KIT83_19620 [Bryobacterales bacterium]|nr:hypothetical protein [Bryobacterales bacterium]
MRPWIAVQVLGALVMVHASALLYFMGHEEATQVAVLGWVFLSLGLMGLAVSMLARTWLGSSPVAWSSAATFFGSLALLAFASHHHRAVTLLVALVVLTNGLTHVAGSFRLRREEQRYRPFLASGAVNIVISALVVLQADRAPGFSIPVLVAGATFTTGLTLFHYGRLLRRMATTNLSAMERIKNTPRVLIRRSKARI